VKAQLVKTQCSSAGPPLHKSASEACPQLPSILTPVARRPHSKHFERCVDLHRTCLPAGCRPTRSCRRFEWRSLPQYRTAPLGTRFARRLERFVEDECPEIHQTTDFWKTALVLTNAQVTRSNRHFPDDESVDTAPIDGPKEEHRTDTTDEESGEVGVSRLSGNGRLEAEDDQITKTQQQDVQAYLEAETPDHGSIDERGLTKDIRTIREWQRVQRSRLSKQEEDMCKRERAL